MYAYFNDISFECPKDTCGNSYGLIADVIGISKKILDDYSIEFTKVPNDFKDKKIANHLSIKDLINLHDDVLHADLKFSIIDFLANRVFADIDEIEKEILKEIDYKNTWVQVSFNGIESMFLTGSYLLSMPTVSFKSDDAFTVDLLPCQFSIEYPDGKKKLKDITLPNLYCISNVSQHHEYLIEVKKDIVFGKGKWNPIKNPIWNKKTKEVIEIIEFPQSIKGKKDKISELKEVGELVAVLNGWKKDNAITKINRTNNHTRLIFTTFSRHGEAYLSVDMKNPKGCFEHYDHRGEHLGEISFEDGKPIPRAGSETGKDTKGKHNLRLKKE